MAKSSEGLTGADMFFVLFLVIVAVGSFLVGMLSTENGLTISTVGFWGFALLAIFGAAYILQHSQSR